MKKLYEAQFNNNKYLTCRLFAKNKEQAIEKFKKVYNDWEITKIYETQ